MRTGRDRDEKTQSRRALTTVPLSSPANFK
ncbi:unnamed protein product, partial [Didymodactylos carnosus]